MGDLNRSIKIYIDGTDAAQGVEKVEKAIAKLKSQLSSLNAGEADYGVKSANLKKQLEQKNRVYEDYKKKIEQVDRVLKNLSGATYDELTAVRKQVQNELRKAVPGTQAYTNALEQNKRVSVALAAAQKNMSVEVGCAGTTISKTANFVNKYIGLFSGVLATITGVSFTSRKVIDDFAQISEAMAGVKKYTGMADEEIKALNESFKKMDTRTARERLNELAQDAGRLGIKGKKDILAFTDAANVINVSLGEDLGEDAVKNIGKLAQMFGDDDKLGLRGAMLATGSAINEVAQNSSASEQYLVDFTARIAGTGKQAGLSQAQIIGYASSLDQDMQQVEMASTALQTVIMKIYQEPAQFAKMAGKDVSEFTNLLKTDANEAVLQFLESLNKKGGLQELAPLFKDMKLDGVRASGVINTLASNIDNVRQEQQRATQAYADGNSVLKEYDVQNNTVQAGLEKSKKRFQEIVYELGEKLLPYTGQLISSTSTLMKLLATLVGFMIKHGTSIGVVALAMASYTVGIKLHVLWLTKAKTATGEYIIVQKLKATWDKINTASTILHSGAMFALSGNIKMAKVAIKSLFKVFKLSPLGLFLTGLTALGAGIYKFCASTSEANKSMNDFLTNNREAQGDLTKTYKALISTAEGTKSRSDMIKEFNDKYGEYMGNLLSEKATLNEIESAYNDVSIAMQSKIAKQMIEDKSAIINRLALEESAEALQDVQDLLSKGLPDAQVSKAMRTIVKHVNELTEAGKTSESITQSIVNGLGKSYDQLNLKMKNGKLGYDLLPDLKKQLPDYIDKMQAAAKQVASIKKRLNPFLNSEKTKVANKQSDDGVVITPGSKVSIPSDDKSTKKEYEIKLQEQENSHNMLLNELKEYKLKNNLTDEEYNILQFKQEKEYYQKRIDLLNTYRNKITDKASSAKIEEHSINSRTKLLEIQNSYDKAELSFQQRQRNDKIKCQDEVYLSLKIGLEKSLLAEKITKDKHDSILLFLDADNSSKRLDIQKEYVSSLLSLELGNGELKSNAINEANKEVLDADLKAAKDRYTLQEKISDFSDIVGKQGSRRTLKQDYDLQLELLKAMYEAKKDAARDNAKELLNIEKSYRKSVEFLEKGHQKKINSLRQQLGVNTWKEDLENRLDELKRAQEEGTITEDEAGRQGGLARGDAYLKQYQYYSGLVGDVFASMQQAENDQIDAKYDAEIQAAQGNAEEVERLETEKAQKKLDIEKKYADVNFAIKASGIIANTAVSIMTAFAQLGPIGGAISAAFLGATGLFQLASANAEREKVKNMTLGSSSSSSPATAQRVVTPQHAAGKYDVIGQDDGKTYKNIPYIGAPSTGIVQRTSLISENGSELIVNAEDLNRLQHHVNFPIVLSAINDARSGRVSQRAEGNYANISPAVSPAPVGTHDRGDIEDIIAELRTFTSTLDKLNVRAYVVLSDITKAQELKDKSEKPFKKGDH